MNTEFWEHKIIAFFEGDLAPEEEQQLKEKMAGDVEIEKIYSSYESLYSGFTSYEPQGLPIEEDLVFDHNLKKEKEAGARNDRSLYFMATKIAASIILLAFASVVMYNALHKEDLPVKHIDLAEAMSLQHQSPSERIKAINVNYVIDNKNVNAEMLDVLINIMMSDESSNVRRSAVETLGYYINDENVKSALIRALPHERDAGVKLAIIQVIALKKDETAKSILNSIIDSTQDDFIKGEAHLQLDKLIKI